MGSTEGKSHRICMQVNRLGKIELVGEKWLGKTNHTMRRLCLIQFGFDSVANFSAPVASGMRVGGECLESLEIVFFLIFATHVLVATYADVVYCVFSFVDLGKAKLVVTSTYKVSVDVDISSNSPQATAAVLDGQIERAKLLGR
ncbi:conserved hypothetical protein [Trichinella spiralis]|uniref:hypothetical protein n=1 Tax=Trichinella spiralis TaxID=6334 RepID=UPI0001EFBBDE|nr:conserved hypothetical protein [Trichinella spiralis]